MANLVSYYFTMGRVIIFPYYVRVIMPGRIYQSYAFCNSFYNCTIYCIENVTRIVGCCELFHLLCLASYRVRDSY
jgi:hypothetical protein